MKKLIFCILLILLGSSITKAQVGGPSSVSFILTSNSIVNALGFAPSSGGLTPGIIPLSVLNVTSSLSITNQNYFGYGQVISNSLVSSGIAGANADGIAFTPYGGNYYGLTITNSFLISSTNEQVGLGFNLTSAVNRTTNAPLNFYDLRVLSSGSNGDAVSWKEAVNAPTNLVNFYNSEFSAAHYAFNQAGSKSTFTFHNCNFRAIGPANDGASVCFMPDAGWVTNYLYGCNFVAANGGDVATWTYLSQVRSADYFYGCSFEATDTNNVGSVACMTLSGEGFYLTELNSCTFMAKGGATAKIIDLSAGGGAPNTLYLNNCTWKGSPTSVVDNTGGATSIIVSGGNFTPANFVTLSGVIFTNYPSFRSTIGVTEKTVTDASATGVFTFTLATGKYATFKVYATTSVANGTDFQTTGEEFVISAVNKTGTVTSPTISSSSPSANNSSSGTLTTAWTATVSTVTVTIKLNADSSLGTPTDKVLWRADIDSNDSTMVVTPL